MVRAAVSLSSFRGLDRPLAAAIERAADAGIEGVEFCSLLEEADLRSVRRALAERSLAAAGAHVHIDRLGEDTERTLTFYRDLGCERLVVTGIPPERFETERAVETAAQRLDGLAVALGAYGVSVHYHDAGYEYVDLGGRTALEYLIELTERVGFDLDAANALAAGVDPVGLLERLGRRAPLVHATDCDRETGERVPLGSGDLDLAACVEAHAMGGGEWLIHEYEARPGESAAAVDEAVADAAELLDSLR